MITIYHVAGTRSMRVIWACEELEIEYETVEVDFSQEYRASAEWRKMNPVGKVPVMTDGDLTMFESGAMIQYILDRYGEGRLQPAAGTPEHAIYLQWSWFGEATFARPVGEIVNHRRAFGDAASEDAIREMQDRTHLCVDAVAAAVESQDYLVGDLFTAADIMVGYSLHLQRRLAPCDYSPAMKAYWRRISGRPAFGRSASQFS